ncbi:MAG: hypothetical protein M3488_13635 [Actinomycetota bacterium]|nr:hypothetical protein [Actinomycetota bacterium]
MTAPAARMLATIGASAGIRLPSKASEPAVVCMASSVAMLSYEPKVSQKPHRITGISCNMYLILAFYGSQ